MKFLYAFAIPFLSTPAVAQTALTTEHARRLYETLQETVTHYADVDESFSLFLKENEWVKCSASALGDPKTPGPDAKYRCEFKVIEH